MMLVNNNEQLSYYKNKLFGGLSAQLSGRGRKQKEVS